MSEELTSRNGIISDNINYEDKSIENIEKYRNYINNPSSNEKINRIEVDEEKSSNHQTIEILNFFENDSIRVFYKNRIKQYSKNNSSLDISRDSIIKNTDETNYKYIGTDNLIGDFEERWQKIEMSKITKKSNKIDIKSHSIGNSCINNNKQTNNNIIFSKFRNESSVKLRQSDIVYKNTPYSQIKTENDIDNLLISLKPSIKIDINQNKFKKCESFIKLKSESTSNIHSTKPSINSVTISQCLEKKSPKAINIDNIIKGKIKDNYHNNIEQTYTKDKSISIKNQVLKTYENIIKTNLESNTGEVSEDFKFKRITTRYKDLKSVERNFYTIMNDINPKIIKPKRNTKNNIEIEKLNEKNCPKYENISNPYHNLKKNKNFINIHNNFSLISRLARDRNSKRINEGQNGTEMNISKTKSSLCYKNFSNLDEKIPESGKLLEKTLNMKYFDQKKDRKNDFQEIFNLIKIKKYY